MAGFQQIIVVGNVGRVEEIRHAQGVPVLNFTLAVNSVSGSGENRREETTWFRIAVWRQQAESLQPYIQKGKQLMIVGRVRGRAYADNNGQPQASLEITADRVQLLGSRDGGGSDGGSGSYEQDYGADPSMSDIPF